MAARDFFDVEPSQEASARDFYANESSEEGKTPLPKTKDFFAEEKPKTLLAESFKKGFTQESILGGAKDLPQLDEGFWNNLVQGGGTITADLPFYAAGATLGAALGSSVGTLVAPGGGTAIGGVVGGGFGAFALPEFLRSSLKEYRDFQEKGGNLTFGEFLQKADKVASETLKSGAMGATLGMINKAMPMLEKIPGLGKLFTSKYTKFPAKVATEATALTGVSAAAEGKMPTAEDFATNALMVLGFHVAELPAKAVKAIGERGLKSGLSPEKFAEMEKNWIDRKVSEVAIGAMPKSEELKTPRKLGEEEEKPRGEQRKLKEEKVQEVGQKFVYRPLWVKTRPKEFEYVNPEEYFRVFRFSDLSDDKKVLAKRQWQHKINQDYFDKYYNIKDYDTTSHEDAGNVQPFATLGDLIKDPKVRKFFRPVLNTPVWIYKSRYKVSSAYLDKDKLRRSEAFFPDARSGIYLSRVLSPQVFYEHLIHEAEHSLQDHYGHFTGKKKERKKRGEYENKAVEIGARVASRKARAEEQKHRKAKIATEKAAETLKPLKESKASLIDLFFEERGKIIDEGKILEWNKILEEAKKRSEERFRELNRKKEQLPPIKPGKISLRQTMPPIKGRSVKDSISFGEGPKPKAKGKEGLFKSFYTNIVDKFYPIEKYIEGSGLDLKPSEDPYILARLFQGFLGKVETFLKYKTFDPETMKWTGKGLSDILKPIKGDLEGFSEYLIAKRSLEVEAQGKKTGVNFEDAKRVVEEGRSKFEKSATELYEYQDRVLDYAEKQGMIGSELRKQWKELYQNYVPLQRVIEEGNDTYFTKSMQPKNPFYKLEGSEKTIIDPLQSIIGNTYLIMRAADQNQVIRALVNVSKQKEASLLSGLSEKIDSSTMTMGDIIDAMKESNIFDDGTVKYFENGQAKSYKLPTEVADAVKGLRSQEFGFLQKIISFPTRLVRAGAITFSPGTLLKLATLDQMEAWLYTNVGYVPFFDMAKGIYKAIKKPEIYWQWKAAGGDQALSRELSRAQKHQELKEVSGTKKTAEVLSSADDVLRAAENISRPLEEATRISVFEKALKRTGMTPDDLRRAAMMARETTLDFARKGAKTQLANRAIPFFNAAIQGADLFFRKLKTNPKLVPKAIAAITLPTLVNYFLNKDRKEYQELPDWEKNNYWHIYIPLPGVKHPAHFKIPRPYELGSVFATVPEKLAEFAYKHDKDSLAQIGKNLFDVFTPSFTVSILDPIFSTMMNKDTFTGKPIVPGRLERIIAKEQIGPYTSEFAKKTGALISHIPYIGDTKAASPMMIDHWINSWTAGLGNKILSLTETALRKTGAIPERIDPDKELSDYPILKAFIGRQGYSTQAKSIQQFYEQMEKLSQVKAAMDLAKKERRTDDYYRLFKEFDRHKYNKGNFIRKAMSKNFSAIRNIQIDNEHYNSAEKKILIDQLINDMVGITRGYLGKD